MRFLLAVVLFFGCNGELAGPMPPPPPTAQRLVSGLLGLVGTRTTACSSGVAKPGIDGDVWCAFYRSGPADSTELWVLDVTRATLGPVACDGTSDRCLRLTSTLWTGNPVASLGHPSIHGFDGDTLMIYADATSPRSTVPYTGPIKAWRPGWTTPRTLTAPTGSACHGHTRAAAAYCLEGVVRQNGNLELDARAGALTGADSGPLASIGHVRALGSKGQRLFEAAFSPDGKWFLVSSPADGEDTEMLRLFATTDGGVSAPREILRGARRWQVSPDGQKLYYLKGFDDLGKPPAGTLATMDFPAITNETVLQANVATYTAPGDPGEPDRGLLFLQDVTTAGGTLRLLRDRARPAGAITIDRGVSEFLISPDLRFTYLAKPGPSGSVARNDGAGSCVLNANRLMYSVGFLPDASTLVWAQDADEGIAIEGWSAPPGDCAAKRRFASNLADLLPVRGGALYAEPADDFLTMTLRYAPAKDGVILLDGGFLIREAIDTLLARGGDRYVLFTVSSGEDPGLYSYGPLP